MNTSTKWCNTLQEYRPLEDFHYDSYSDDGRQPNCKDAKRDILNPKSNPDRMFVGGKYVAKTHPKHRPGNYADWNHVMWGIEASGQESPILTGEVYIVVNPAYPEWVKVGMAQESAEDRLKGYQTGSPFRDYEVAYTWRVTDRRKAEAVAHAILKGQAEKRNEWFKCSPAVARMFIEGSMEEFA